MTENSNKNRRILIIDDNKSIHEDFLAILAANQDQSTALNEAKAAIFGEKAPTPLLQEPFEVDSAYQGQEGLELLRRSMQEERPYAMAFVDVRMPPGWDGIETIQHLWQEYQDLQVVICTAYSDYSWHDTIRQLGQTDRLLILKKPFDNVEVCQIACALTEKWHLLHDLDEMVKQRTAETAATRDVAVFALATLAESRDTETGEHLERMRSYCQILAEELSQNSPYADIIDEQFRENMYRTSPLHDIGKVGIPDKILLKPSSLTEREFAIMKEHSIIGAEALEKASKHANSGGFLDMAADIARYHHERFDGSGYPDGLAGEKIPLSARIVALADVYDALTSTRVYKPAFRPEVSRLMIEEEKGKHFDPVIVDAFLARIQDFLKVRKFHDDPDNNLVKSIAYNEQS